MSAEQLAPGLWRIVLPSPAGQSPATVNCYAFAGGGRVGIVDPGWDTDEDLAALQSGLAQAGLALDGIDRIVVTHWHPDHLGLAARLRELTGAPVALGRGDQSDAGIPIDEPLDDDGELELGGRRVRVVSTPGHTAGSVCLDVADAGLLLTGDTVLPVINPGIGLGTTPGNPIGDYLASLDRIAREFADRTAAPGHGDPVAGLAARCAELAAHHRERTAAVAAVLAELPGATVEQIAPRLSWTGGWEDLGPFQESALRQTAWHRELAARSDPSVS